VLPGVPQRDIYIPGMKTEKVSRTTLEPNGETAEPIAQESRSRIPPGKYKAICYATETGRSFGGRRDIYILFRIQGSKYDGTELYMVCTYPKRKISSRHKIYEQWSLAEGRRPAKGEKLSGEVFTGKMYEVLIRDTQRKYSDGSVKPDFLQYSLVESIIRPLTGVPKHE
jgi:hypothetical protein